MEGVNGVVATFLHNLPFLKNDRCQSEEHLACMSCISKTLLRSLRLLPLDTQKVIPYRHLLKCDCSSDKVTPEWVKAAKQVLCVASKCLLFPFRSPFVFNPGDGFVRHQSFGYWNWTGRFSGWQPSHLIRHNLPPRRLNKGWLPNTCLDPEKENSRRQITLGLSCAWRLFSVAKNRHFFLMQLDYTLDIPGACTLQIPFKLKTIHKILFLLYVAAFSQW